MTATELKATIRTCLNKGTSEDCTGCPYEETPCCVDMMMHDAVEIIEGLEIQLQTYHKADTFLAAHGWKWGSTNDAQQRLLLDGSETKCQG